MFYIIILYMFLFSPFLTQKLANYAHFLHPAFFSWYIFGISPLQHTEMILPVWETTSTSPVSRDWVRPSPAAFRPTSRFHQAHSSDLCQRESNGTGHCWSQAMIRAPSHDAGAGGAAHVLHLLLLPRTTQEQRLGSSNFLHLHFSFLNHRTQILQPTEFTS